MLDKISKELQKKGYKIYKKEIDNETYHYYFGNDRIFFLMLLESNNIIDEVENYCIQLSEYIEKDLYKEFFHPDVNLSENDLENKFLDLRAFLWDIYVICIHVNKKENFYSVEEKVGLSRNSLIAQKIIIEEESIEKVIDGIIKKISPIEDFEKVIREYDRLTQGDNIVQMILAKNIENFMNYDDKEIEENIALKNRVGKMLQKEKSPITILDIVKYLEVIQEYSNNFNIDNIRGD